jgi:predicted aldo/keto reductase-like oxidoreductase
VSALGFGTMRFQMTDGHVDQDLAVSVLHRAMELGVNYFDSAVGYCNSESEATLGKALKGRREGMVVSTKYPVWAPQTMKADNCRKLLEQSLTRLDLDYLDVYHMHSVDWESAQKVLEPGGAVEGARQAQAEGLIKHLAFSFHDNPKRMIDIIDACEDFAVVTCQYNLLDRGNEESIAYAHEKGLGVVVMGPVAGGRLASPSEQMQNLRGTPAQSTPEIALRFVLSNPDVTVALSGMSSLQMVEENVATASHEEPLSAAERDQVLAALDENRRLADLYCTGCNYCMPCPNGVNIPGNFSLMNLHRVWGLTQVARQRYGWFGPDEPNNLSAAACVECGQCEPKCPQKIPIIDQLKETERALGESK